MKKWLQSIADKLQLNTYEDNGKRMASTLVVLLCLDKLVPQTIRMEKIEFQLLEVTLLLLCPRPDPKNSTCPDLDFVFNLIPTIHRKMVYEALNGFCMELSHRRNLQSPQWLYALPLLHFLKDPQLRYFYKLQHTPHIPWVDKTLGLGVVRSVVQNKNIR